MPRPRICRRVGALPGINLFKPAGVRAVELEEVVLTVGEYESVRLKDLEGMDQDEAAKKIGVSQPTFHRLLLSARKKIAEALVKGKAIKIEGGTYKTVQSRITMGQRKGRGFGGPAISCVCPSCGYQTQKQRGVPCADIKCPKCNSLMIRG